MDGKFWKICPNFVNLLLHVFYFRYTIKLSSLHFNKIFKAILWFQEFNLNFHLFLQVIKTRPGQHLTVHYQSITGETFELHVHDGNTINATQLTLANQWTGINQALKPSSSSGHELFIKFRFSGGSYDARLKFLITDDEGKIFLPRRTWRTP